MRIVNNCKNPVFIPYAGRKKRGVQLDPGQAGPDIGIERLKEVKRIASDLEQGRVVLAVTDEERKDLKGKVNAKYLVDLPGEPAAPVEAPALIEEPAKEEETDVIASSEPAAVEDAADEAATVEDAAPAPTAEDTAPETEVEAEATPEGDTTADTEPDVTKDAPEAPEKVDPVLEDLITTLSTLTARGRATKLRHLKKSTDKGIIAALPAAEAHFKALKDAPKSKPKVAVEVDESAKPKSLYADKNRAELMSAIVKRSIDVDPAAKDAELIKALDAADAAK